MAASSTASAPSVRLLLGEEELLVERAVERALGAARSADETVESYRKRVSELTPPEFVELVSPSLFSSSRVIVLENAQESGTELASAITGFAKAPGEGIQLLVAHSGGGRSKAGKELPATLRKLGAEVTECAKLTKPADREKFVRDEVRRARGTIEQEAVSALIDAVGTDLRELAAASSQLVADTGGSIDAAAVRRYHNGKAEVTGFAVAEKAIMGDRPAALEALRWAMHLGVAHVLVADALADAVRTVFRVSTAGGSDPNRLASELGMPPWKARKALRQARGWHSAGLADALQATAEVNADVKGVAASAEYALERAVERIIAARSKRPER